MIIVSFPFTLFAALKSMLSFGGSKSANILASPVPRNFGGIFPPEQRHLYSPEVSLPRYFFSAVSTRMMSPLAMNNGTMIWRPVSSFASFHDEFRSVREGGAVSITLSNICGGNTMFSSLPSSRKALYILEELFLQAVKPRGKVVNRLPAVHSSFQQWVQDTCKVFRLKVPRELDS